jgi:hypothetical protein
VVRAMVARIADSTGRNWIDAVTGQLHVSEFVIYGVFADHLLGATAPVEEDLCHNYYERVPLSRADACAFAEQMPSHALGVMISSHSGTPHDVRREVFSRCRQIAEGHAVDHARSVER